MKKAFKVLAMSILCLVVLSVVSFAAENIAAKSDGTFPASYADGTKGEYYALVVVKGIYAENETPEISEDTVLHIDQVTAGAVGALFEDFTPKTDDAATVYVGGSDLDDGPVILGYINIDEEDPVVAEIPVKKDDVVYKAGDAIAPVKIVEDGVYKIAVNATGAGTYVVNSAYTAQKIYNVAADGTFTNGVENGLLGDGGVSVRYKDYQGIRFYGHVLNALAVDEVVTEYGFIMTAESAANGLDKDYVLDMDLVEKGKAKKGVAYGEVNGEKVDIFFDRDASKTLITGVLYGIPKTADGVQTVIVSRPYYIDQDGVCVYGEETRATLYEVAKSIYGVEGYEEAWDYAKEIIDLVEPGEEEEDLEKEIAIDVSKLYK